MIDRYAVPEVEKFWSFEARYGKWVEIEKEILRYLGEKGLISPEKWKLLDGVSVSYKEVKEEEKRNNHEVISFLRVLARKVEDSEVRRFLHFGLTSSDLMDTGFGMQLRDSNALLQKELEETRNSIRMLALKYRHLPMVGRTHNVHAEPITLGLKFAVLAEEFQRSLERLLFCRKEVEVGKLSGAVGTYPFIISPADEERILRRLGLKPFRLSTQVVQRDVYAHLAGVFGVLAGTIDKTAVQIRLLQSTEILELEEPFDEEQRGSSAMPHKRNPIRCERLSGLARLVRAGVNVALENQVLWHERDISHSSAERVVFPDFYHVLVYSLRLLRNVLKGLRVRKENIAKNLELTRGLVFSQRVLSQLVLKGYEREEAYELVKRAADKVWREGVEFREALRKEGVEVEDAFDLKWLKGRVDEIFSRLQWGVEI